jgi:hypothetical protein
MDYKEPITKMLGNTKVTIYPPNITDEERQKRLKNIESVLSTIFGCEMELVKVTD